jgi:hypothetical protein
MAKRFFERFAMVVSDKNYSFTISAKIHRRSCLTMSGNQRPPFPAASHAEYACPWEPYPKPELAPLEQA